MLRNPEPPQIRALLGRVRTIAVVGLSPKPDRPSFRVAQAMQGFGYTILPVRPGVREVLGQRAYPDLAQVPDPIDLVDVFRAPDQLTGIVDTCLARRLPALWLQEGVVNAEQAQRARAAGLIVVMDRCLWRDYLALFQHAPP